MKPYVYQLIDKLTGKWYIGSSYSKRAHPEKLGVIYFTSSKVVRPIFKENPDRFEKKILVIGPADYVLSLEVALLHLLNAKDDMNSYNASNGDAKANSSKAAIIGNMASKAKGVGIYASGFYQSESFLRGAKEGGITASKRLKESKTGIFKEGFFESESFLSQCRNQGKINADLKKGVTGRNAEKMSADNKKAAMTKFKCDCCGKMFNGGNLMRHRQSIAKAKGE